MNSQINDEEMLRERRRRQRLAEAKRRKRRQRMIRKLMSTFALPIAGACIIVVLLLVAGGKLFAGQPDDAKAKGQAQESGQADYALNGGGDGYIGSDGLEENGTEGSGAGTAGSGNGTGSSGEGDGGEESGAGTGTGITENAGTDGGNNSDGRVTGAAGDTKTGSQGSSGGAADPTGAGTGKTASGSGSKVYSAQSTSSTRQLGEDIVSSHAILIDLDTGSILAQKDAKSRMNPASMTKILTVLVAAEHVTDLDDTFTITLDITDYSYVNDCSSAGFAENETVTVRDLFYGTILPSGADAAAALATYVAGSKEAFVDMMNDKLEELGLADTANMTNCVGLYNENHYCTAYDMAMILQAAMDNELCREVMSAHTYTTTATQQHPEGLLLSNWFLRRIEDKDTGGEVLCAKTGYVVQSGNCAASYAADGNGKKFLCVTGGATSAWRCIYDHVALYKQYSTSG